MSKRSKRIRRRRMLKYVDQTLHRAVRMAKNRAYEIQDVSIHVGPSLWKLYRNLGTTDEPEWEPLSVTADAEMLGKPQ
jgi:predicted metallo-beta-lactamase superfamily hydrolase